jgi:hypothetical protein
LKVHKDFLLVVVFSQALTLSHTSTKLLIAPSIHRGIASTEQYPVKTALEVNMDIGQWIVIGLSALFLVWFLVGVATSRKLGDQVLRWVQEGTRQLGRLSNARRIRGSAVQLTIKDAAAPFRQVDLIVALEQRENPPLWLYHHLNGKRDELVIQGMLRSAPKQELEIARTSSRLPFDSEPAGVTQPKMVQVSSGSFMLKHSQGIDRPMEDLVDNFLSKYGEAVLGLQLKRSIPHLQVHLRLAPLLRTDSQVFMSDLQGLLT